jgi:hypothetical protein
VLSCFDISNSNYHAKAFKLAFDSRDASKIIDESAWPVGVNIRPWNYQGSRIPDHPPMEHADLLNLASTDLSVHDIGVEGASATSTHLDNVNNDSCSAIVNNNSTNAVTANPTLQDANQQSIPANSQVVEPVIQDVVTINN